MEKLNKILKNVIVFLAIFLVVNYVMQSCSNPEEQLTQTDGNLIVRTTDNEYSRRQVVTLEIQNNRTEEIVLANECPGEPFNVFRYENNDWVQKTATPELDCSETEKIVIASGEELKLPYQNWNNALFSEMGRFRIEFATTLDGEEKTISSNEFVIVKEGIFRQLWIGLFYRPIYNALMFFAQAIPGHNLGWAIIILTLIIRTILLIPSQKAMRSQKRMQELQPRLEKIKQKYKGDQQKIAMETMAAWKEAKVNPFGSCLPLLLQFPFLIALFYVIQAGLNPDNSYLLYVAYENFSIADINTMFLGLDLTKINIYVLPFIIGGLQFFQLKLSFARRKKKSGDKNAKVGKEMAMANNMMMYIMPVMIAVFTASLPAGVGIYWGTSTLYGIVQQVFVNREGPTKNNKEVSVRVVEPKN